MNPSLATAMLLDTTREAQRINTCDASMECCHFIRAILTEPNADDQLDLLADLFALLGPRIICKSQSDELAETVRWLRGSLIPQLRQDRATDEAEEHERMTEAMQRRRG